MWLFSLCRESRVSLGLELVGKRALCKLCAGIQCKPTFLFPNEKSACLWISQTHFGTLRGPNSIATPFIFKALRAILPLIHHGSSDPYGIDALSGLDSEVESQQAISVVKGCAICSSG